MVEVGDKVEIKHHRWNTSIEGTVKDMNNCIYTISSGYSTHYVAKNDPDWSIKKLRESPKIPKVNGCSCGAEVTYGKGTNLHAFHCREYKE